MYAYMFVCNVCKNICMYVCMYTVCMNIVNLVEVVELVIVSLEHQLADHLHDIV